MNARSQKALARRNCDVTEVVQEGIGKKKFILRNQTLRKRRFLRSEIIPLRIRIRIRIRIPGARDNQQQLFRHQSILECG